MFLVRCSSCKICQSLSSIRVRTSFFQLKTCFRYFSIIAQETSPCVKFTTVIWQIGPAVVTAVFINFTNCQQFSFSILQKFCAHLILKVRSSIVIRFDTQKSLSKRRFLTMASQTMLALVGFLMIVIIVWALLQSKTNPVPIFVVVPIVAAVICGF